MACGTVTSPLRYKAVDHGTDLVDRVFRALLKLGAKPSDPKHEVCDETSRELHSLEPRMAKGGRTDEDPDPQVPVAAGGGGLGGVRVAGGVG